MTFRQAIEYCESFINHEKHLQKVKFSSFSLQNIKKLLSLIDNPQDQLKIIHVAGSKGKGSTCAAIASILYHAGYKVGFYSSPHLEEVTERIRILGDNKGKGVFIDAISEEGFCLIIEELKPYFEQVKSLTYFEILTASALFYFVKQKVDFVVLETGLGGRLDATNVGEALVCVLTSIGLEHTAILGETIGKIAREKVGIIKNEGQKVVAAPQLEEAQVVIENQCRKLNIRSVCVGKDIVFEDIEKNLDGQLCYVKGLHRDYGRLRISLFGYHQVINAATSIGAIECLQESGVVIKEEAIRKGLSHIFWPGRFEVIKGKPIIVLDSAHTPDSVKVAVETFQSFWPEKKAILILGLSDDKDRQAIGMELSKVAKKIIATKSNHPRAYDFKEYELQKLFLGEKIRKTENVQGALDLAYQESLEDDIIFVTGSVFIVGEVRSYVTKQMPGVCLMNE